MNPPKRLTDPAFVYIPACRTDVGARFAQIYRDMKREQSKPAEPQVTQLVNRLRKI